MNKQQLANKIWESANKMRSKIEANEYKDYILGFIFYKYLSDQEVKFLKENDFAEDDIKAVSEEDPETVEYIQQNIGYFIAYENLFSTWLELGRDFDVSNVRDALSAFSRLIHNSHKKVFENVFRTLETGLSKLGDSSGTQTKAISGLLQLIKEIPMDGKQDYDVLGFIYEYLIEKFAANAGKKAGEFYTPQQLSTILSKIVILDSQDPALGEKNKLDRVLDFACGSGSLLLNVRRQLVETEGSIGKIYGQEKNITTYNLARMNMLLHGLKDTEFEIHHGDTLINDWNILNEMNPAKKMEFDAIVANPPFSLRWEPNDTLTEDFRFKNYGIAPKSAADFAFLLHGFHFLSNGGTMAIILPHGVLFRSGAEERIRTKLLKDNNIDTVIGLPSNLFFSTGIPVCILVLKKCKKFDDVLFINASEHFEKDKRQNRLREGEDGKPNDIQKIIETYQFRKEEERYSRRVSMDEIEQNGYNLNISRYVSTFKEEEPIDIHAVMAEIKELEAKRADLDKEINVYLKELGLIE